MPRLQAALAVTLPWIIAEVYQPINETWTVKTFGCGCPRIDGTAGPNANDVNTIGWSLVLGLCLVLLCRALNRMDVPIPFRPRAIADQDRWALLQIGIVVILWGCVSSWARSMWL